MSGKKHKELYTSFSCRIEVDMTFDEPTSIEEAREKYINGDLDVDNIVREEIVKVGY